MGGSDYGNHGNIPDIGKTDMIRHIYWGVEKKESVRERH